MIHYSVTNDVVYFPDDSETYVPVVVKEDDIVIRTELWTIQKVEDLQKEAQFYSDRF
jgi:hypothetical protein